ncbi:hypothetical protein pipiens_003577 [Culex pipiens pipiens]|uniref:Uncharacterized protein n=1 Tax=Culex pipiens pipiens TaxID=38569 RepID=A0ABD1CVR9_CULPP
MEGEMDGVGSCYGGGDIAGAIFGTLLAIVLVAVLGWWLYKKGYVLKRKERLYTAHICGQVPLERIEMIVA